MTIVLIVYWIVVAILSVFSAAMWEAHYNQHHRRHRRSE